MLSLLMAGEPVFAVHEAGHQKRDHIVPGGVDHGGGRVHQIADGHQNGEGHLHLPGEEEGADDVLPDVAAAGDAGHPHRGQHRHRHDGQQLSPCELLPEYAPDKGDLQHAAEARAVHVHGGPQRNDHLRHVPADAGVLRRLQIGGDGGHR